MTKESDSSEIGRAEAIYLLFCGIASTSALFLGIKDVVGRVAAATDKSESFKSGEKKAKKNLAIGYQPLSEGFTPPEIEWEALIEKEAKKAQLPADLIAAVIEVESSWDKNAVSPSSAIGLMQIIPGEVIPERPVKDKLFDPQTNIATGTEILAGHINRFLKEGDSKLASVRYGLWFYYGKREGSLYREYAEKVLLKWRDKASESYDKAFSK